MKKLFSLLIILQMFILNVAPSLACEGNTGHRYTNRTPCWDNRRDCHNQGHHWNDRCNNHNHCHQHQGYPSSGQPSVVSSSSDATTTSSGVSSNSSGGISGGAIAAIAIGGVAGAAVAGAVIKHFATKESKFVVINKFDTSPVLNSSQVESFLTNNPNQYKLIQPTILKADNTQNNLTDSAEKLVNYEKYFSNNSNDQQIILIKDTQIMDKTLHLYSLKLPENILKTSKNIYIDVTFVYNSPYNVAFNKNSRNIDLRLFNDIDYNKVAKIISNHKFDIRNEHNGIIKAHNITLCENKTEKNTYTIEKHYKLSNINSENPVLLTVSSLKNLKNTESDYVDDYSVILKIKNAS